MLQKIKRILYNNSKGMLYFCPPWYEFIKFTWFQRDSCGYWEVTSTSLPSAYPLSSKWCLLTFCLLRDGLLIKHYLSDRDQNDLENFKFYFYWSIPQSLPVLGISHKPSHSNCYCSFLVVIKSSLETELFTFFWKTWCLYWTLYCFLHHLAQAFFAYVIKKFYAN